MVRDENGESLQTMPPLVAQASANALRCGFTLSCDPDVGRLLAVLAAAVPAGGRILELGTGAGVGTAWLVHGLADRSDVELITCECDPGTAAVAAQMRWPGFARLVVGDATDVTRASGSFDLVFADAQGGKWEGLATTIAALRPGGHLLVDDMAPSRFADAVHATKVREVRESLISHPGLLSVVIGWSSGLILSTRRHVSEA
jgi:demethylmenaquinone methyltransferase/2-methoxy-6-polyprenyl-1,4-benzoquinol methylase